MGFEELTVRAYLFSGFLGEISVVDLFCFCRGLGFGRCKVVRWGPRTALPYLTLPFSFDFVELQCVFFGFSQRLMCLCGRRVVL